MYYIEIHLQISAICFVYRLSHNDCISSCSVGFAFYKGDNNSCCYIFGCNCNENSHKPYSSLRKIFIYSCFSKGHQGQELSLTTYSKRIYHLLRFSVYKPCFRCNQYGNFCVPLPFTTCCGSSLCI